MALYPLHSGQNSCLARQRRVHCPSNMSLDLCLTKAWWLMRLQVWPCGSSTIDLLIYLKHFSALLPSPPTLVISFPVPVPSLISSSALFSAPFWFSLVQPQKPINMAICLFWASQISCLDEGVGVRRGGAEVKIVHSTTASTLISMGWSFGLLYSLSTDNQWLYLYILFLP